VRLHFVGVASRVGALCGIWANCKSFLLAPRRRNDRVKTSARNFLLEQGDGPICCTTYRCPQVLR
jgi:hypothetical protein